VRHPQQSIMTDRLQRCLMRHRPLLAILLFAVAFKCVVLQFDAVVNRDGLLYITAAQKFSAGLFHEAIDLYPMALYPFLISMVQHLVSDWVMAARMLTMAAMVLTLVPFFLLTRDLFDEKAAVLAGIVLTILPAHNEMALDVVRGPVYALFFMLATYSAHLFFREKTYKTILAAFFFAVVALLLRIEAVVLFPVFVLLVGWKLGTDPRSGKLLATRAAAVTATVVAILLLTALVSGVNPLEMNRLGQVTDRISDLFSNQFFRYYADVVDKLGSFRGTEPFSKGHQSMAALVHRYNLLLYLVGTLEALIKVLFPVMLIPLAIGFSKTSRKQAGVILLAAMYLAMVFTMYIRLDFTSKRFFLIPVLLLLPWIGEGIRLLLEKGDTARMKHAAAAICFTLFALGPVIYTIGELRENEDVTIRAGKWIAERYTKSDIDRMVANDPRLLFYADPQGSFFEKRKLCRNVNQYLYENKAGDIEDLAEEYGFSGILLTARRKHTASPQFVSYTIENVIEGRKNKVMIYMKKAGNDTFTDGAKGCH
jgi:4-amino-4-deoxy-L-arabinose transferase-like glycosyltransferase